MDFKFSHLLNQSTIDLLFSNFFKTITCLVLLSSATVVCQSNHPDDSIVNFHTKSSPQHFHAFCGTIVSKNHTKIILKNPHYPEPTYVKAICEMVIERANQAIHKLDITFKQLELYRSSFDGDCIHDRFGVYTDLNAAVTPTLCGNQTGKSISIPFEAPHTSLVVSITTSDLDHDRIWHLEIEQIAS